MEKIIPGKVKIIYNDADEFPLVYPMDVKKVTKVKRDKLIRYTGLKYSDPNIKEIILENSGFKISFLDQPGKRRSWIKDGGRGNLLILICLYHPSIEKKFSVYVEVNNFMEILPTVETSRGNISGTFCLEEKSYISGVCGVSLLPEDHETKKEKEFNLTVESLKRTTIWKPGYIYVLENRSRILYLGETTLAKYTGRDIFKGLGYGGTSIISPYSYNRIDCYESQKVFVPIDNIPDDTWEIQLNLFKGFSISNFLEGWLDKIGTDNYFNYRLGKCAKSKVAVQYEKFLEDDRIGENLGDLLSTILATKFKNTFPIIPDIKLSDIDNDQIKDSIILDLVDGLGRLIRSKFISRPISYSDLIQNIETTNFHGFKLAYIRSYYYLRKNLKKEELEKLIESKFNDIIN